MTNQECLAVLFIVFSVFLKETNGYYYYSYTTLRMKMKMVYIDKELVMDAIRNTQRIDHIKDYYSTSHAYDIAQMLYFIRSKFARLVRIWTFAVDNDPKYTSFQQHLPVMVEIQHLSMDIYNLIEMLEEYEMTEHKEITKKPRLNRQSSTPKKARLLRQRFVNTRIPSFGEQRFQNKNPNRNKMKVDARYKEVINFDSDID